MTLSFESDRDIIVYTLEKIIAFAQSNQNIFLAQIVWWISSVIGLQSSLVIYINNLRAKSELVSVPTDVAVTTPGHQKGNDLRWQDKILKECEDYLQDSRRLWKLEALKAKGKTRTGWINPLASTKSTLKVKKSKNGPDYSKTEGIEEAEILRRKRAGECLCFAWPSGSKGSHKVKDRIRKINLEAGIALPFEALWIESSEQESSDSRSDI